MVVKDNRELAAVVEEATLQRFCVIDTEFMWRNTYDPRLALIQMAISPEHAYTIDPMAVDDFKPLARLLCCPDTVKVLHACSQDLEIFYRCFNVFPCNVFDTQIAAAFCGMGFQLSYGNMIHDCLGIALDKTQQFSNWTRRPLSEMQIQYALNDVSYLYLSYQQLKTRLQETGRLEWVHHECKTMLDHYTQIRECQYHHHRKIKGQGRLNSRQLTVLYGLVDWREATAKAQNLPARWVLEDNDLLQLASELPTDKAGVQRAGIPDRMCARYAGAIVARITKLMAQRIDPELIANNKTIVLNTRQKALRKSIHELIKEVANGAGIAPEIVASTLQISAFILDPHNEETPLLQGWRRDLLAPRLLRLMQENDVACD